MSSDTMNLTAKPGATYAGAVKLMIPEIKRLDTTHGYGTVYTETVHREIPEKVNWWERYALCLTRHMRGGEVAETTLEVNSQHLREILRNVIGTFPGITLNTKSVSLSLPCRALFFFRGDLEEVGQKLIPTSEAAIHLRLLIQFIYQQFEQTIVGTANLREQGLISFKHIWTLFQPDCAIFSVVLGQPRAFQLLECHASEGFCSLQLAYVDLDGDNHGYHTMRMSIPEFDGAVRIESLVAMPLELHPNIDRVTENLIRRGERFEEYSGTHFANYSGVALALSLKRGATSRVNTDGRIVVDCKTLHRLNADYAFVVESLPEVTSNKVKEAGQTGRKLLRSRCCRGASHHRVYDGVFTDVGKFPDAGDTELLPSSRLSLQPLTDEQRMMANASVRGFSFAEKQWLDFFIDQTSAIEWNEQAFDQLVLPELQKHLVKALVSEHTQKETTFDDIIKGKGKGLVLVLHGPPGVGKTLTAECVAEYTKRPLYSISSGDLGVNSKELDERLCRILDMAATWKVVLLIDEADVFLEARSLHDMHRNAFVSIFLRVLEYYKGILFMTSNRVSTFDDAFKSRIHVPLKYDNLPASSRQKIWTNLLSRMENGSTMNEDDLEKLSQEDLNGRQIKNIVRTATSLAHYDNKQLNLKMLEQVIMIQMDFERDLEETSG